MESPIPPFHNSEVMQLSTATCKKNREGVFIIQILPTWGFLYLEVKYEFFYSVSGNSFQFIQISILNILGLQ